MSFSHFIAHAESYLVFRNEVGLTNGTQRDARVTLTRFIFPFPNESIHSTQASFRHAMNTSLFAFLTAKSLQQKFAKRAPRH